MSRFMTLGVMPDPVTDAPIEFGEWLPDMPELNNPGAVEALNVMPSEGGYVPFCDLAPVNGITSPYPVRGAVALRDSRDKVSMHAGTSRGIYTRVGSSMVQSYGADIILYNELSWLFVPYGNSLVALHPQLRPLVGDVGGLPSFSPLGGNPPIARAGSRVGDFLVLGNLDNEPDENAPRQPNRIRWSAFNNIEAPWTTDPATQSDFNDMPAEGGEVVAITGRENGTIFQSNSISRMQYVGLPTVFDISTVEEARGAISRDSVIDLGTLVFFIAEDGFFMWNGTNAVPLGDNKINRYFFSRLNYALRNSIVGAVDFVNSCVVWAFPTTSDPTLLDELIIFSYKENKFSHSDCAVQWIMDTAKFGTNLDDLHGNLDTDYPISFDSSIYRGGKRYLGGFNPAGEYGIFNGTPRAVVLDTAEATGPHGRRLLANNSRPIIDVAAPVATVQAITRDQLVGGALQYGAVATQEITGECPLYVDARYARFRVSLPAGTTWKHALGVIIWRNQSGMF